MPIEIQSPEDNGNIRVVSAADPNHIILHIDPDSSNDAFYQWFHFDAQYELVLASEENSRVYTLVIENAGTVSYPDWNKYEPYQVYASYDRDEWMTIPTVYDEDVGHLIMTFTPEIGTCKVKLAFFPPYTYARHLELIETARGMSNCSVTSLGSSLQGRDMTLLTFGSPALSKKEIWVIARQHPGEPQAEWFADELIHQIQENPALLNKYTFRVVPNMNPDGTYLGHLRTNAAGKDLNRMWGNASMEGSPEVYCIRQKMQATDVDLFLDLHSDETIPKPFLDRAHFLFPHANPELEKQETLFMDLYMERLSGMQNELNYGERDRSNPSNRTMASPYVGSKYDCPSFTLEMPTKLWSVEDCRALARDFIPVMLEFYETLNPASKLQKKPQPRVNSFFLKQQTALPGEVRSLSSLIPVDGSNDGSNQDLSDKAILDSHVYIPVSPIGRTTPREMSEDDTAAPIVNCCRIM